MLSYRAIWRDRRNRLGIAALFVVLCLAGTLRWHAIGAEPFWTDEFYSLIASTASGHRFNAESEAGDAARYWPDYTHADRWRPLSIWRDATFDSHPPLYATTLGLWRLVVGTDEAATRSLSALCSLGLIVVMAAALRVQTGRWRAALWAAVILSVSGQQIAMAQEARPYAMMWFLAYLSVLLVLVAVKRGSVSWPLGSAIALAMCGAMLTQYLAAAPLAAISVYAVWKLGRARGRFVVVVCLSAGLFLSIWYLPAAMSDLSLRAGGARLGWMGAFAPREWPAALAGMLWDAVLRDVRTPDGIRFASALLLVFPLLLARRVETTRPWILIGLACLVLLVTLDLIHQTRMITFARYTALAVPAIVAACCVAAGSVRSLRDFVPMLLLALCFYRLDGAYRAAKDDWRHAAAWISARAGPHDVIVFTSQTEGDAWAAYLMPTKLSYYAQWTGPRPQVMTVTTPPSTRALRTIDAVLDSGGSFWLVGNGIGITRSAWFERFDLRHGEMFFPFATVQRAQRHVGTATAPSTAPAESADENSPPGR